jgi:hypothetical protein
MDGILVQTCMRNLSYMIFALLVLYKLTSNLLQYMVLNPTLPSEWQLVSVVLFYSRK